MANKIKAIIDAMYGIPLHNDGVILRDEGHLKTAAEYKDRKVQKRIRKLMKLLEIEEEEPVEEDVIEYVV